MAFDRQFTRGLILRLLAVLLALGGLAWALLNPDFAAVTILTFIFAMWAAIALWRHVQRTNTEVARFIDALRFGDMQARFSRPGAGGGFDVLGETLDRGIRALQERQSTLSEAARFYEALVDDVPVALLTTEGEAITLANKAARKLFNWHEGVRPADFECYGHPLVEALMSGAVGQMQTVILNLDTGPQRALLRVGALARINGTTRVIAVQVIQQSLNAVEIAAQSDLVRVLTHEIMNSLTPVTSLARTAAELMVEADDGVSPTVAEARVAVETLAKRADGILHFVETYREITRPPKVERRLIPAAAFIAELVQLFRADQKWREVTLVTSVVPTNHLIDADPDLLAQVLINLLRNAAAASAAHHIAPRIDLTVEAMRSGRTLLRIQDNGPGIPQNIRKDIFLPFFTTRPDGTGVGLSFARQAMLAHDGSIEVLDGQEGATFRIFI